MGNNRHPYTLFINHTLQLFMFKGELHVKFLKISFLIVSLRLFSLTSGRECVYICRLLASNTSAMGTFLGFLNNGH